MFAMNTTVNAEDSDCKRMGETSLETLRPVDNLRFLLDVPKPKDDKWQHDAGRAVSLVAIQFMSDPDDMSAMRAAALLGLSQSLGVKEARKRTVKLTRWANNAPPPLMNLAAADERQALLSLIVKLNVGWSQQYVERNLAESLLPQEQINELLRWVRVSYLNSSSFILGFFAPQIAKTQFTDRLVSLLKDAPKLLRPNGPESIAGLAEALASLVDAFFQSAKLAAHDEKIIGSCVNTILILLQSQAAVVPALLLHSAYISAVARLVSAKSESDTIKSVASILDGMSFATISLLMFDLERYGVKASDQWVTMVPLWREAYPRWDALISLAIKDSPNLALLTKSKSELQQESLDINAAADVFARLLPAWDAFVSDLPEEHRAESLSNMIRQAAGNAGVKSFGERGAVVRYDPLSHHLVAEQEKSPEKVEILRPGVQLQRPDGSSRVLVAALVATLD